jgi:hypothetical protein
MESKSEYVAKRIKEFHEKYVDDIDDFDLELLYSTEFDLMKCPTEHVKTKYDLIKTYYSIKDRFQIHKKQPLNYEHVGFIFDNYAEMKGFYSIIHKTVSQEISNTVSTSNQYKIKTKNTLIECFSINCDAAISKLAGKRFDDYFNFCHDKEIHDAVNKLHLRH